ncbi:hypothetical protein Pan181_35820 [Aeoliella mucimassa]|uniref:Uncharacterized protein n=1 Tax=Aeoliella mucimassa TaxID=2527972 RepID=A0A518ARL8_9BACT|nr:hypothetical protein Pan181_35820 [Aeoliella mucimassa]
MVRGVGEFIDEQRHNCIVRLNERGGGFLVATVMGDQCLCDSWCKWTRRLESYVWVGVQIHMNEHVLYQFVN